FQAEDGIRDATVTGVQTCALPILGRRQLRQDFNTPVVTFRADDLEQLAAAYKTSPEMLRRSLQEWGVFRPGEAGERPEIERESRSEERRVGKGWRSSREGQR